MTAATSILSFDRLVLVIGQTHADLAARAARSVNTRLTLCKCFLEEQNVAGKEGD